MIEANGTFRSSAPVTQHSRNDVSYCIVLPRGATLAGIYHSHVSSPTFSAVDKRNAERVGVPSYVGTIRGSKVLVYDPRAKVARAVDGVETSEELAVVRSAMSPALWELLAIKEQLATLLRRLLR